MMDRVEFIKKYEGLSLKAYICPTGYWTIGYGHTKDVCKGDVIDKEKAEQYLNEDILEVDKSIESLVSVPLTNSQRIAITSFIFNLGAGAFKGSTFRKKLNRGDVEGAGLEILKWCYGKVGGKKVRLPGLIRRRTEEFNLWSLK